MAKNTQLSEVPMDRMTMLGEHLQWHTTHKIWEGDTQSWLKESEDLKRRLEQALMDLEKHRQSLGLHVKTVEAHEARLLDHDRELRKDTDPPPDMKKPHQALRVLHARQYNLHEQIKKRHHTILAHVAILGKALA
jgi:hypothetical protein